jgi:hypothetical protein
MWKKQFIMELGGFDETFQRLQDVELNTRALMSANIKFEQFDTSPDCYYRISDERRNFNEFVFLQRWVSSAIQYCNKFKDLVKTQEQSFLLGTIFQTMLQLFFCKRNNRISKDEFKELYGQLNSCAVVQELRQVKKLILAFSKWYNLEFIHVPGLNRLILISLLKLRM